MAERYTEHVRDEFRSPSADRAAIELFAGSLSDAAPVLDAGCGPGHLAAFVSSLGPQVAGVDASAALIEIARTAHPEATFSLADLAALPFGDQAFAGVIARHSLIHTHPEELGATVDELVRVLRPDGVLFVSFFAANGRDRHGQPFDHAVCTAYELHTDAVSGLLSERSLDEDVRVVRQPRAAERQLAHVALIAHRR